MEALQAGQASSSGSQANNFRPFNMMTSIMGGQGAQVAFDDEDRGNQKKRKVFDDDSSEDEDIAGL